MWGWWLERLVGGRRVKLRNMWAEGSEAGGPVLLWELGLDVNWPGETNRFLGG